MEQDIRQDRTRGGNEDKFSGEIRESKDDSDIIFIHFSLYTPTARTLLFKISPRMT